LHLSQPVVDRCPHLVDIYGLEEKFMVSPLIGDNIKRTVFGGAGFLPVRYFLLVIFVNLFRKIHLCQMMRL
jgi:hypothetical protein